MKIFKKNKIRKGERGFQIGINIILILFTLFTFLPFWLVVINSFATEASIANYGFRFFPTSLTLDGYRYMFSGNQIYRSYGVTIFIVVVGTALSIFVTTTYAYVLSHRKVKYRNILSFLTYFAMLMGAGLIGFYILVADWLSLKDTIWAMILPQILNPFFAFILVAAFREVPYEIYEAAYIDGSNDFRTFFQIAWPISLPAISTVGLFYALNYWNNWWLALLFVDNYKLHPLQMMIRQLMSNVNSSAYVGSGTAGIVVPANSIKMVVVCATIGPIILVYPFIQKYFVKGITLGAVKG